jgi:hypothetical protein
VVIGPIGFDWILSIAPPFASSSFGASLGITQLIAGIAFALSLPLSAAERVASDASRARGSATVEQARADESATGDLGGLLLAFTLGITYVDFMAVLVIWYGDLPRSTAWFVARDHLPWTALAWAAFLLVSLVPFGALIVSRVRTRRAALRIVAAAVLVGLFCYDAYLIAPPFGVAVLLAALLATIAIGFLVIALIVWPPRPISRAGRRPAYGE